MADNGTFDTHFTEGRRYRMEDNLEVLGHANWVGRGMFLMGCLALLLGVGCIYLGMQPKLIPVFLKWDSTNGAMETLPATAVPGEEPSTIRQWLREFVETMRGISTDKEVVRQRWNQAIVRTTHEGRARLVAEQAKTKPLETLEPVRVEILRSLKKSGHTWDIWWEETPYTKDGDPKPARRCSGLFTFQQRAARTAEEMKHNGAGIFFHEWGWSCGE